MLLSSPLSSFVEALLCATRGMRTARKMVFTSFHVVYNLYIRYRVRRVSCLCATARGHGLNSGLSTCKRSMRQSLLSQMFQLTATPCVFRPSVKAPKIGSPLAADRFSQRVQPNRSKTCLSLQWPQVLAVCMWQRAQALASYMSNMACTHSLSWQKLVIPRCHLLDMCDDALDPVYVFLENSLVMPAGILTFSVLVAN